VQVFWKKFFLYPYHWCCLLYCLWCRWVSTLWPLSESLHWSLSWTSAARRRAGSNEISRISSTTRLLEGRFW